MSLAMGVTATFFKGGSGRETRGARSVVDSLPRAPVRASCSLVSLPSCDHDANSAELARDSLGAPHGGTPCLPRSSLRFEFSVAAGLALAASCFPP